MNESAYTGRLARLLYRLMLGARYLERRPGCRSIGAEAGDGSIQRIYVINLDRHGDRWLRVRRELGRVNDRFGKPLTAATRRFSAVDARYYSGPPSTDELRTQYSLADQLFVEPHPLLARREEDRVRRIEMTQQEVAVALSHIAVWKLVAASECKYTLVLEDDVYFRRGFGRTLDSVWAELTNSHDQPVGFDILYLSYKEARTGAPKTSTSDLLFRPLRGLWQLSGYVLSQRGARKLLHLLPVRGPVDLWINHQFENLDVFATRSPIIEQRLDSPSSNTYSILPVLSQVGVLNHDKPFLPKVRGLPEPVFAVGTQGSGLSALAMALSMLGYRCCSDMTELPINEQNRLARKKKGRVFNAYVNVGSLTVRDYIDLARLYPRARFILTELGSPERAGTNEVSPHHEPEGRGNATHTPENTSVSSELLANLRRTSRHLLILPLHHPDKWELLCRFLEREYPSDRYPTCPDRAQRQALPLHSQDEVEARAAKTLRSDASPWIVAESNWQGIRLLEPTVLPIKKQHVMRLRDRAGGLDHIQWMLRDDTFPSNLALFRPRNFSIGSDNVARLTLREERTSVRSYTSAAVCTRQQHLYGRFVAEVRPTRVAGLVTGVFLHRNAPRQEIDIEFLGKDTTKMLVNVYYNPGDEGARLEFGYRGTPALVDLGFDASENLHRYEIEWRMNSIRWRVDGRLVHERFNWNPTPIPHLPMEFNVNLWPSRSTELCGKLAVGALPAQSELRSVEIHFERSSVPSFGRQSEDADDLAVGMFLER